MSHFSDVIYTTSKSELKIRQLSQNTKVLDIPPSKKLMPALCDEVTKCFGSLTISLVIAQHGMCKLLCMHLFVPETNCCLVQYFEEDKFHISWWTSPGLLLLPVFSPALKTLNKLFLILIVVKGWLYFWHHHNCYHSALLTSWLKMWILCGL